MTFKQLESKLIRNAEKIVAETALSFNADIKFAWPVGTPESTGIKGYVGGFSKSAWQDSKKSKAVWTVANHASYSAILWRGRIGNRGSWQMPNGGDPILNAARKRMMMNYKRNLL